LIFCPQCGANQLAVPDADESASGAAPRGFASRLREFILRGRSMRYVDDPYPTTYDYESIDESRGLRRLRRTLYVCGALAVAGFAAYLVVPGNEPSQSGQTVAASAQGATDARSAAPSSQDIDIAGLNIAPSQSQPKTDIDIAGLDVGGQSTPLAATPDPSANGSAAPASKSDPNWHADATRPLDIARANLKRNDLWAARRAIEDALFAEPDNADALRLRADLASRERDRDLLLDHARQCARIGQWHCARQYAGRAASIDTSSRDAKRLLARGPSGTPHETVVHRDKPDLLARLHHWFQQSLARADTPPRSGNSVSPSLERP
jgi:hypothetical protein